MIISSEVSRSQFEYLGYEGVLNQDGSTTYTITKKDSTEVYIVNPLLTIRSENIHRQNEFEDIKYWENKCLKDDAVEFFESAKWEIEEFISEKVLPKVSKKSLKIAQKILLTDFWITINAHNFGVTQEVIALDTAGAAKNVHGLVQTSNFVVSNSNISMVFSLRAALPNSKKPIQLPVYLHTSCNGLICEHTMAERESFENALSEKRNIQPWKIHEAFDLVHQFAKQWALASSLVFSNCAATDNEEIFSLLCENIAENWKSEIQSRIEDSIDF